MNIKKIISLLVIIAMICLSVVSFAACNDNGGDNAAGSNGAENAEGEAGPEPQSFLREAATGDRNNYGGSVGYEFEVLSDITVSAVGRPLNGEMNRPHTIRIWEVSTQTLLASAEVTPDSPLDALGFKTAPLNAPLMLKAGERYRIVSSEEVDGDMWYDVGVSEDDAADLVPSNTALITTPVFTNENEWDSYPANEWNPGGIRGYVGATFYYLLTSE